MYEDYSLIVVMMGALGIVPEFDLDFFYDDQSTPICLDDGATFLGVDGS